jgi:uncharacterized protein (TIGR02246 family)
MRNLSLGVGLVCALTLWPVEARGQDSGAESVDAAWMKAMKTNDGEAVAACYASDAVLWFPNSPEARGAKAIHDAYAGFLGDMTVENVAVSKTVYQTSGDLSTGWGNFTLTVRPKKGGDAVVMQGRFIDVAKRIDGRWLYVADHASLEPMPASTKP